MTDEADNLILHHLRELRAHIDDRFDESKRHYEELRTEMQYMNAVLLRVSQGHIYGTQELHALEAKVNLINQRLQRLEGTS